MQPTTNRDVWSEILRYFKIRFTGDTSTDIRLKRRVMLSVALTCSWLADVALDELWGSMTTLQPIVRVFDHSSKPGLRYQDQDEFWDIGASPTEIRFRVPRAQSYLDRVRCLYFASFPDPREVTLWQALLSYGRISVLCPNLTEFFLALEGGSPNSVYNFSPLVSPSITNVTLAGNRKASSENAALVLLNMFSCHNAEPLEISYNGHTSPLIFQRIAQFSSLRSLVFTSQYTSGRLDDTHIASLQHLVHLGKLEIDMDTIGGGSEKTVGRWLTSLGTLSSLKLHGQGEEIQQCLFTSTAFNSLHSLSLFFRSDRPYRAAKDLLSLIYSTFPGLQSLFINDLPRSISGVTLTDILILKERPMKRIGLHNVSPALTTEDIAAILTTWPMLKELSIIPETGCHLALEAKDVLLHASTHGTRLNVLCLPLDFHSLVSEFPPLLPSPKCPLQVLRLPKPRSLPNNLKQKHILARNLVALFPRLSTIETPTGAESPNDVRDLQVIVNVFQDIISSPQRRSDCLFYE